ncbi:hypothetical protein KGF56_003833 [Candida oxycetoniae]|uniref:Conserved oligomeric Golgi complex subunit 8 n=1 Tax=Candida oxycetoniae TaxID=497107 RepID=A0AAI9WWP8_9ASCO|nr:uncharacterized protein KGF56_003833 [Candida oxycetoniae]KAI3403412.2 hypothetical protein KGF56_003833 [Candida oxycetoniae]
MSSSILLNTLQRDLDPRYQEILNSNLQVSEISEKYLQDLLVNDELLSIDTFKTSTTQTNRTIDVEIAELDSSRYQLNQKLSLLTNSNKDLIIDVNRDLNDVHDKLSFDYQQCLNSLSKNLHIGPNGFLNREKQQLHSIRLNNATLSSMDSVLDVLELPTLCKLCILQGNYQESLDIAMFAKSLIIRFPKLQLFKAISKQIESELQMMLKGLIKLLNTDLKQNQILKIFQVLSQLENVDEASLQRIFLNSRFKYIINEISSLVPILKFSKLTYLKRFVETYREHIYSTLSMYHTIFKDEINLLLLNKFVTSLGYNLCDEFNKYLPSIRSQAVEAIDSDIELKSSIDGLLLQLIYLCKSLATFQFEFEPLILEKLCFQNQLIKEEDWLRNMAKVKKYR